MDIKKAFMPALYAALLLFGAYFYYEHNALAAFVLAACFILFYYLKNRKNENDLAEKEFSLVLAFLFYASIALIVFRFYRLWSFPYDYFEDEWNEPLYAYWQMTGQVGFFDYSKRLATSLPFFTETIYIITYQIIKHHMELLRTIPFLVSVATAAEMYFLGKELKNKNFGIILLFVYAVSGWTFFLSRELMVTIYLPFLTISVLLLFFKYINSGKLGYYIGAGLVFTLGFFTYTSWLLIVPFIFYLLFEYRQELGRKKMLSGVIFICAVVGTALALYFTHKNIVTWAMGMTVLDKGNPAVKLISNIKHIPEFFMLPIKASIWFTNKVAILSFAEFILLLGGVTMCFLRARQRLYRIFLTGFIISLATLIISSNVDHHMRHIMALPFVMIISGLFLSQLAHWRYSPFLLAMTLLFFVNTAFCMYLDWNNQLLTDSNERNVAEYINKNYRGKDTLFIYSTTAYGMYSAYFHSRQAFEKVPGEKVNKVIFITTSLYRYYIRQLFPWVKTKYFYDYDNKKTFPLVLYELDLGRDPSLKDYFLKMSKELDKVNVKLWALEYEQVVRMCDENYEKTSNNGLIMLKNTFFRSMQLEGYGRLKMGKETMQAILDVQRPMFITSDWYMKVAAAFYQANDLKNTLFFVKKAVENAPEWGAARTALNDLYSQGMR